ncbi:sensor histidine kinase [Nitratireductor pacificus]|uniref:histidine kinase n=1 Tax=Nitratireductor pacificus pht-3B TaxID=391937 RepID=K2N6K1_9HYPH|nr:HAMP domain-containing sensor histidine kinase [Nitratireductor pacificus]EKF19793.1 multi-sensor signal transduction histidine kinase [Nitratireductor pacificus pht-3B]
MVAVLFGAPFLFAAASVQLLSDVLDMAQAMALGCAAFGLCWMLATAILATARRGAAEIAALALGTLSLAGLIAAAGGLSSPMAIVAFALAAEAFWVAGTRRALLLGGGASLAAAALGGALTGALAQGGIAVPPSAAHWFVPVVYLATLLARLPGLRPESGRETPADDDAILADRMNALILRMNRAGEVSSASRQAGDLLQVRSDILLGSGFFERVHVADRVAYLCALSDIGSGARSRQLSIRLRMPAEQGDARVSGYRRFGVEFVSGAEPGEALAVIRDEGDKAQLEDEIAYMRERERATRAESRRVLAAVSHELRTPLNAILGFSDTLQMEIFGRFADERQREYVRLIHEAGAHLLSVVNATLEVSKVESGTYVLHPEAFSFADVVEASLALTIPQTTERPIAVKLSIADDVGVVHCDRRAVQQVLINLLSNAVKFTPENGEIVISAERTGDRIDFSVADNGVGIAADDLQRIGEPFMQVRSEATRHVEGTGLGLALVRGLVGLQGGGVMIDSAPGEGTRVTVSLPVGAGTTKEIANRTKAPVIDEEWTDEEYRKTA